MIADIMPYLPLCQYMNMRKRVVGADKIEAAIASRSANSKEQDAGEEDATSDTHR